MYPDDSYLQSQVTKRVRYPLLTILILSICFCFMIDNYSEPEIKSSYITNDDYVLSEESHSISSTNVNAGIDNNMILSSDCNCNNFFSTLELNINDLKSNIFSLEEVKKTTVEQMEEIISHHENLKIIMIGVTNYLDIGMEMDYLKTLDETEIITDGITIPRKCDVNSPIQNAEFDFDYGEFEMKINDIIDKITVMEANIKNIVISNRDHYIHDNDNDKDSMTNNIDNYNNNNNNNSQSIYTPSLSDVMVDSVQFEALTQEVLQRLDSPRSLINSNSGDGDILPFLEDSSQTNDDTYSETNDSDKIISNIEATNVGIERHDKENDRDMDIDVASDTYLDRAQIGAGGRIVKALTSESFNPSRVWFPRLSHILGRTSAIGLPEVALTPNNHITNCWLMNGDKGSLTIRLAQPIKVDAITIDHISSNDSNIIASTVKDFQVYGHIYPGSNHDDDNSEKHEGRSEFILEGQYGITDIDDTSQRFFVPDHQIQSLPALQTIELKILSNHGTKEFTCLHRFRVHGSSSSTSRITSNFKSSESDVI